ncbi:hypothetical protein GCM10022243_62390 [Saccharothrix violaceirubra]
MAAGILRFFRWVMPVRPPTGSVDGAVAHRVVRGVPVWTTGSPIWSWSGPVGLVAWQTCLVVDRFRGRNLPCPDGAVAS